MRNKSNIVLSLLVLMAALASSAAIAPADQSKPRCGALIHIGDSITISMGSNLRKDYESAGFQNIVITASNGRSITGPGSSGGMTGLQAVNYWRAKTPSDRCWVIALGTNDAISTNKQSRISQMNNALNGDRALWVNISINSKTRPKYNWLNGFAWNYLLVANGLRVYDWASDVDPAWLSPDGIHYTSEGSRQRSAHISRAAAREFSSR